MQVPSLESTPSSSSERHYTLSSDQITVRRQKMAADVWLWMKWICQPQRSASSSLNYVERFHRPLAYLLAGDALRLAASLEAYKSEVTRQLKSILSDRGIDWRSSSGIKRLQKYLYRVNNRISRSMGKTSTATDVLSWIGSHNPDLDIGIGSKSDPAAWGMCQLIGSVYRSNEYALYYPERLYRLSSGKGWNYDSYITQEWVQLNGGNKPDHKTFTARGINSQWYSLHFDIIYLDDLASTEAKQGVATVEDALRFIASLNGISKASGTRRIFSGTITGPRDDNSVLASNSQYISTCIPVWTRPYIANMRTMMMDGDPVLPEWYTVERIREMREDELKNPNFGRVSWLQNFELTAHQAGVMQFTPELLNRAKFRWVAKEHDAMVQGKIQRVKTRWIRRYLFTDVQGTDPADGSVITTKQPKRDPEHFNLAPSQSCLCWMKCGYRDHAYVEFDPNTLPRVLGVDQSYSSSGDKWSIGNISRDHDQKLYALRGRSGHEYTRMIGAIVEVADRLYGGRRNFPRKVGIESNAVQSNTAYWMKRSEDAFGLLARRVVPVSPGGVQKTLRIFNNVYAALEAGDLYIDPDDVDLYNEALDYDPSADDPNDNILDSIAIGCVVHSLKASDVIADKKQMQADDREYWSGVDSSTGVDLSTDFTDMYDPYEGFGGGSGGGEELW